MTLTRVARALGLAAALSLIGEAAHAQVTYSYGDITYPGYAPLSFSFTVNDFINSQTFFPSSSITSCSGGNATFNGSSPAICTAITFFTSGPTSSSSSFTVNQQVGGSPFSTTVNFSELGAFSKDGIVQGSLPFNSESSVLTISGSPTVTAAPEPFAWALLLMGVGAIGFVLRRRRASSIVAA